MFSIVECLIQATVGKGLYERYQQRQTLREVRASIHSARGQRSVRISQKPGLPYDSFSPASSTSCAGGDATAIDTPPTDPATMERASAASAVSSSKSLPSSTATLGRSPLLKPVERALIPDYNVVHNHWFRNSADLDLGDPAIMQSYAYSPLDIGPAIGFQAPQTHRQIRAPPRKFTDLERLPPLSSEVAAEMACRANFREQAGIFAKIREAQEKESEAQRRANRTAQMMVPPYVAHIPSTYSAEDLDVALLSELPPTPPTRPMPKQFPTQRDQHLGHLASDALRQGHVRWAPEPASQGRDDSTELDKENYHRK